MNPVFHRRGLLQAGLVFGASLAVPAAHACEYFSSRLRVLHPWTRATEDGAAHAIVCMRFDEVEAADRLIGIETPVATGAELAGPDVRHGAGPEIDLPIPAGSETVLSEGGTHLRLLGLQHKLEVGRSYPLKLVFEQGGVVHATLNVDYTAFRFK